MPELISSELRLSIAGDGERDLRALQLVLLKWTCRLGNLPVEFDLVRAISSIFVFKLLKYLCNDTFDMCEFTGLGVR